MEKCNCIELFFLFQQFSWLVDYRSLYLLVALIFPLFRYVKLLFMFIILGTIVEHPLSCPLMLQTLFFFAKHTSVFSRSPTKTTCLHYSEIQCEDVAHHPHFDLVLCLFELPWCCVPHINTLLLYSPLRAAVVSSRQGLLVSRAVSNNNILTRQHSHCHSVSLKKFVKACLARFISE